MNRNPFFKIISEPHKTCLFLFKSGLLHLKTLAFDLGLIQGHLDYNKFIILGRGRSGSNFLRGLLNSHSQVIAFGELFRFLDSIGWEFSDYDQYMQSSNLISLMQKDPVTFLQKKVFRKYPKDILAVGFKLFYYHAQEASRKVVWRFLRDQKNLKIIHLKRNNVLRQLLSEKIAFKTNRWSNITGELEPNLAIRLDYDECLYMFKLVEEEKRTSDIFFKGHEKLDIIYENLAKNYKSEMRRVQTFLGLNQEALRPCTYRQSSQPLSKKITNYLILKKQFTGTRWEVFFEE